MKNTKELFRFQYKAFTLICPPDDSTDQTRVLGQDPFTLVELNKGFHRL